MTEDMGTDMESEIQSLYLLNQRMADLLTGTAAALKGPPGPLTLHDWSDLPSVAEAVMTRLRECEQRLDTGQRSGR